MNNLIIEKIENGTRFTLTQRRAGFFARAILFLITFVTLAIPFIVLFSSDASQAMIVGAILSAFFGAFILRLLLWNVFGKEVFDFQNNKIIHYTDYWLYKDELLNVENSNKLLFSCQNELGNQEKTAASEHLNKPQKDQDSERFIFTISNQSKQLTRSNIKLTQVKVQKIIEHIKTL